MYSVHYFLIIITPVGLFKNFKCLCSCIIVIEWDVFLLEVILCCCRMIDFNDRKGLLFGETPKKLTYN